MVKYLLLLVVVHAKAAPLVQPQDVSFSTFTFGGVSVGTNTMPTAQGVTVYGIVTSSSPIPSVACSAGSPVMGANSGNQSGTFTAGAAATTCTVTFKTPWPRAPVCFCNASTPLALSATTTTTTVACAALTALTGDTLNYFCWSVP
jgi:hypothetical protein